MGVILLSLIEAPQYPLVCFIQSFRQFIKKLTDVRWEAMLQRVQLAEYPSEPVQQRKKLRLARYGLTHSHSIGSFCQRPDYEIFIICRPSPHRRIRGRVYDVLDVVGDIRFLSTFVMQGNRTKRQWLDDSSDVDLWSTGNANVKILQVKVG